MVMGNPAGDPSPRGKGEGILSTEPAQEPVRVTLQYVLPPRQEPGVLISAREYERMIERLEGCKPSGWADLWLAGVGVGAALAAGALVGALTLPPNLPGTRDVLWGLVATGVIVLGLCLFAYIAQRRERGAEINELKKDLDLHRP
jgi:hypothetical protein